jgi:transposase-like protein
MGNDPRQNPTPGAIDRLIPPPRELALELAASGLHTWSEIAERVGVHRTTLYDWRRDPTWAGELRRIQRERRDAAARLVEADIPQNIRVLREIRDDKEANEGVRRQCARDLLELAGVLGSAAEPISTEEQAPMSNEALAEFLARKAREKAGAPG